MPFASPRPPFIPAKISALAHHRAVFALARLLSIGSLPLAAVMTLSLLDALQGQWLWIQEMRNGLARHAPQLPAEMLPIPAAFLLWVRLMERTGGKFALGFSPLFAAMSTAAFVAAQETAPSSGWRERLFALGVAAGLFVLAPFQECARRALKQPRTAIVAIIAATAGCNYYFLMKTAWDYMCGLTMQGVYALLRLFHVQAEAFIYPHAGPGRFAVHSPYFSIVVHPACNGLEGIFLFIFMLSVMLLIDWELFKRRSLLLLYEFGIIYMFLFNIFRIFSLFVLGYWAYRPDAWSWVHSLQGAPFYLFHSYVGWLYYLAAFGIFARWMYRLPRKPNDQ